MEFIRKGTNPKIFQGAARKLKFRKYENKLKIPIYPKDGS